MLAKRERALYERLLITLSDQVDWYRAQLQMVPPPHLRHPAAMPSQLDEDFARLTAQMGDRGYYDEDEETILEELRTGGIDLTDAEAALAQIGALNREINFT